MSLAVAKGQKSEREDVEGSGGEEEREAEETCTDRSRLYPFRSFHSDDQLRARPTFFWVKYWREMIWWG
jgi:hypothetical protein